MLVIAHKTKITDTRNRKKSAGKTLSAHKVTNEKTLMYKVKAKHSELTTKW